ncbi:hypothetical protein LWI28_012804 [Acer negundo]|uniref:Uncharacterized protein n=1 Tax=Acer negundo TaxID=4023 RepID=A0AAD5IUI5_ACENE|nr:hypothetical protein LWI28_012804 [Acer negundo]
MSEYLAGYPILKNMDILGSKFSDSTRIFLTQNWVCNIRVPGSDLGSSNKRDYSISAKSPPPSRPSSVFRRRPSSQTVKKRRRFVLGRPLLSKFRRQNRTRNST